MNQNPAAASWRGLLAADPQEAAKAADALLASQDPAAVFADAEAAKALVTSVEGGNRTASSVLLLGYCPDAGPILGRLLEEHGDDPVKLKSWSRMAPLRVAAMVALSRLGDRPARERLLGECAGYDDGIRVFLLDVLAHIDAPQLWHEISKYLDDQSEIPEDVPSGAARRRVCDHAVDAFLDRFHFDVSFPRNPGGRYSIDNTKEILRLLQESVPR